MILESLAKLGHYLCSAEVYNFEFDRCHEETVG